MGPQAGDLWSRGGDLGPQDRSLQSEGLVNRYQYRIRQGFYFSGARVQLDHLFRILMPFGFIVSCFASS